MHTGNWAWNRASQNRLIFLFDIMREPFRAQQNAICRRVRAFLLLQWLMARLPLIVRLPKWVHYMLFTAIRGVSWAIYPIQRRRGVLLKHS